MTGEVKKLSRGLLELSTDHMGTLEIQWSHIDKLTSKNQFVVELENGQRFVGSIEPGAEKEQLQIVGTATETVGLPAVVGMARRKKSFWDQLNGSANLGFSFTQSNTATTWTASANANYLNRNYLGAANFSSNLNSQEGTDYTTRNMLGLTLSRFFGEKWFLLGLSQFLQSDELGFDLRTTLGGALGRSLIHTNRNTLSPVAGLVYSSFQSSSWATSTGASTCTRISTTSPRPTVPGMTSAYRPCWGMDSSLQDATEVYIIEDNELPMVVFGALSLVRPGSTLTVEGLTIPVPRLAGLLVEKLLTDQSAEKGARDLLVALALLTLAGEDDLAEIDETYARLVPELRHAVRSNLTLLSLMEPRPGMPDPGPHRARIAALLRRLERMKESSV